MLLSEKTVSPRNSKSSPARGKIARVYASAVIAVAVCSGQVTDSGSRNSGAHDPRVRAGAAGAGTPLPGLSATEMAAFLTGQATFAEVDNVANGLGPRFNMDSCAGCHAFPAVGGASPVVNPQVTVATKMGARNTVPSFLSVNGPIREVRFKLNPDGTPDGGVHDLFTIRGRSDAPVGCSISQPDFSNTSNVIFRIPTPNFGAGLIEAIPDTVLKANIQANSRTKTQMGISGRLNTSGNDGTVTRFGWKAQNKSLTIFAGEAYNVEQGVTNVLFIQEREEDPTCARNATPEDAFPLSTVTDVNEFSNFMRFLDQPAPAPSTSSASNGRNQFVAVGCALCHTPTLTTGNSSVAALRNKAANLYSDLALHTMGSNLADGVSQGGAGPSEFRSAPLWGLGQRIFFLHDGRTSDLMEAIRQHSGSGSEANAVISGFQQLSTSSQQDILNFLRSL